MKLALTAMAVALAAAPAIAQDTGFYADAGYSFIGIDTDVDGFSTDVDLGAIIGHVGYNFGPYFGAEAEGAFGVDDEDVSVGGFDASLSLNYLIGAYGRVQYPLNDRVNLFARVGVVNAELEAEATGLGSDSDSETGAGFGAGADLFFDAQNGVRLDYTRYDIEDLEADAFTIAYKRRF